jgi:hypothetical protein
MLTAIDAHNQGSAVFVYFQSGFVFSGHGLSFLIDTAKPLLDELMGGASFWIGPGLYREVLIHPGELEHRPGLSCKELQRLGHEVRVELEHATVPCIGIDDEVAVRKTPRQIAGVLGWNHAITLAVRDKHRLANL